MAALRGEKQLEDFDAYAQSKLGITQWTRAMAARMPGGPVFVALNPGSLLATKMVKEGFNFGGHDIMIGAKIIVEAALGSRFEDQSGQYFDNDSGVFAEPAALGLSDEELMVELEQLAR